MTVKESNTADGDYVVEIKLSYKAGDKFRMFERTGRTHVAVGDIPLIIAYSMGADFEKMSRDSQKAQILAMVKALRVAVNEVMEEIGKPVGARPPGPIRRRTTQ
jgi:hypothetical protein